MNFLQTLSNQMFPIGAMGGTFPVDPGMSVPSAQQPQPMIDPAAAQVAQRNAMISLGLGLMAARDDRQGLGHGAALAFQNAQGGYQNAMDNAFRNTLLKRQADYEQQDRDRQAKLQQQQDRQNAAVTASRVAGALKSPQYAANPQVYWQLVQGNPDVQEALKQAGVQVPTDAAPDYGAIAQQLGTFAQASAPTMREQNDPAEVAAYKYWASLTPEQQQDFLRLKRNVGSDYQVVDVNGVPTVVYKPAAGYAANQPGSRTPLATPLSNLPAEAAAASTLKQAEGTGAAVGRALGEIQGGIQTKAASAIGTKGTLDIAEPLIDAATGSATGAAMDKLAAFFGKSTSGAEAIAQLRVLQANLMTTMPRMEGPQSDRDVDLYRQAAGQIGDPQVPSGIKKAAVQTIRALQDKYIQRAGAAQQAAAITATGPNGQKVVLQNGQWVPLGQ